MPSRLFVLGATKISLSEGTTQGDPLAMPVYAIGITPLLEIIKPESPKDITMKHVAFADDLGGGITLQTRGLLSSHQLRRKHEKSLEESASTSQLAEENILAATLEVKVNAANTLRNW